MPKQKKMWDNILTVIMTLLSLLWIYPIVLILLNSLKVEGSFTTSTVFKLPTAETFAGLSNYVYGVTKMGFLSSLGYSLVITVTSVALILLCCSMTGWYLTRVNNKLSKFMNLLIVFSMVVPFQMVMFTLSKTADQLNLNTPWNICIIYLGFGAGLAVFMFTGFMKSVPIEIEEAAMIDGCNPIQIFFKVVFPILKPTMISTAILETMWVWNDYLLPTLVLDIKKYRTIPMAIQYFRGGYGRVELAPMMACIIIAIIPIIIPPRTKPLDRLAVLPQSHIASFVHRKVLHNASCRYPPNEVSRTLFECVPFAMHALSDTLQRAPANFLLHSGARPTHFPAKLLQFSGESLHHVLQPAVLQSKSLHLSEKTACTSCESLLIFQLHLHRENQTIPLFAR